MPYVHRENALVFRESVGTATTDDGEEIELTTGVSNRAPIVRIKGRFVSFSWEELIILAQDAIDKEKESDSAKSDSEQNSSD